MTPEATVAGNRYHTPMTQTRWYKDGVRAPAATGTDEWRYRSSTNHELPPCEVKACCIVELADLTLPHVTRQWEEVVEEGLPQREHLPQMVLSAQLVIVVGADHGCILHPEPSGVSSGEQPACHVGVPRCQDTPKKRRSAGWIGTSL